MAFFKPSRHRPIPLLELRQFLENLSGFRIEVKAESHLGVPSTIIRGILEEAQTIEPGRLKIVFRPKEVEEDGELIEIEQEAIILPTSIEIEFDRELITLNGYKEDRK
jgi:hypothetical protein